MPSPHDVLGVRSDADQGAIDRAYRRRVKESHPDLGGSAAEFKAVQSAYEELSGDDPRWTPGRQPPAPEVNGEYVPGSRVEYVDYDAIVDAGLDLDVDALFDQVDSLELSSADRGHIEVARDRPLLESAEDCGLTWPYACRGGACANCAVAVTRGDLSMPPNHVLPDELVEQGIRLSCVGAPLTRDLQVVFNLKHRPDLDELRLPPDRFDRDRAAD